MLSWPKCRVKAPWHPGRAVPRCEVPPYLDAQAPGSPDELSLNIYFACSLTGGRSDEETYQAIVAHLLAQGHEVPTAHLAEAEVMELEKVIQPGEVYTRDAAWIRGCDALVAEVSTPSHGVGYEIAFALSLDKPVLCCYRSGARVSKMITGNDSSGLRLASYERVDQALAAVDDFLDGARR